MEERRERPFGYALGVTQTKKKTTNLLNNFFPSLTHVFLDPDQLRRVVRHRVQGRGASAAGRRGVVIGDGLLAVGHVCSEFARKEGERTSVTKATKREKKREK